MQSGQLKSLFDGGPASLSPIPLRAIVGSLLFHTLLLIALAPNWLSISSHPTAGGVLSARLVSAPAHESLLASVDTEALGHPVVRQADAKDFVGLQDARFPGDGQASIGEGYLPQEFLSRSPIPEQEINLQDITPPDEGAFQMYVWIDSRGEVTRVDLSDQHYPAWFTEQVVDRFKQSRFKPGLRGDRPTASIMHVEVMF